VLVCSVDVIFVGVHFFTMFCDRKIPQNSSDR
jgi:hypothetical protein